MRFLHILRISEIFTSNKINRNGYINWWITHYAPSTVYVNIDKCLRIDSRCSLSAATTHTKMCPIILSYFSTSNTDNNVDLLHIHSNGNRTNHFAIIWKTQMIFELGKLMLLSLFEVWSVSILWLLLLFILEIKCEYTTFQYAHAHTRTAF